ncbi:hypothetical protein [Cryptosporangium sp. NPDC048952]|uniref:hypothetical protein n=1 Tax=Cryptosporangium sp. NPDC048952 TaxID=3363961 RepID=UPI003717E913
MRIVVLVAVCVLLAGCAGQPPVVDRLVAGTGLAQASATPTASASVAAEPRDGRLLTPEQARSALPDIRELPGTGWDSPASGEDLATPTKPAECSQVGRRGPAVQRAEPTVLESIVYRTQSPPVVDAKFFIGSWTNAADGFDVDDATALAKRCAKFTAFGNGKEYPVIVEQLEPPPIGEKQFAVRMTVVGDGYLTIFWSRTGHDMVQMSVIHNTTDDQLTPFRSVLESIDKDLAAA